MNIIAIYIDTFGLGTDFSLFPISEPDITTWETNRVAMVSGTGPNADRYLTVVDSDISMDWGVFASSAAPVNGWKDEVAEINLSDVDRASQTTLLEVKAKTDLIPYVINVDNIPESVDAYGNIFVLNGNSYESADGTEISLRAAEPEYDLTGATAIFRMLNRLEYEGAGYEGSDYDDADFEFDLPFTVFPGEGVAFVLEMTSAETSEFEELSGSIEYNYNWQIVVTTPDTLTHTIAEGTMAVSKTLTPPIYL
jgi:hypothetical protein